jgi:hypothetical protein
MPGEIERREQTGHTPGPWSYVQADQGQDWDFEIVGIEQEPVPSEHVLAQVLFVGFGPEVLRDGEANARLMSAAPELLEALEGVVRVAGRKTDEFDKARNAIAKARGGVQ